jgi:hypothetical protein
MAHLFVKWDTTVRKVTLCELDGQGLIPGTGKNFSLQCHSQTGSGGVNSCKSIVWIREVLLCGIHSSRTWTRQRA